ncbi:hypothetical protein AS592_11980 [Sulfurovum riftiae]|uniref:histidine kinase n=2 Tax=Sulfurovum riftiae TaxID=1630136 RepID=A0A151CI42_9BACT|nr:hypothetical protein AS592_11980 [Sulfurovum riftiae]
MKQKMKNIKISSFIFILIAIFLIMNFVGYKLLYDNIRSNHEKDTKILFHTIKDETSNLLVKAIQQYKIQKQTLLQKHRIVEKYMNNHDLNVSLDEIHRKINEGHPGTPYDIYITDKNLTIRNTTYEKDMGFNLGFAKKTFEENKAQGIIGCSYPIREIGTGYFLSYTSNYLSKNGDDRAAILQVSYTYKSMAYELERIEKQIRENSVIQDVKAYSFGNNSFIYDMVIDDSPSYIHSSEELLSIQKKAKKLSQKLDNSDLNIENFSKDGKHYQRLYMSTHSPVAEDIKVVYTLLLNDDNYYSQLTWLNILLILSIILGIAGILFISKVRSKELRLMEQDKFVQSAMHEIKTPLSIITLNNELREIEFGKDIYSEEINAALKLLHHSYNSMGYIISKEALTYEKELTDLSKIVKERIEFFQTIAKANDKKIKANINSTCHIEISPIELTRLIDNNLSNALKYSKAGSTVEVTLHDTVLSFHSQGDPIRDKEKVFEKYFRENSTVGGYGLGLSIVKEIADKYGIEMKVASDIHNGTVFTYIFRPVSQERSR